MSAYRVSGVLALLVSLAAAGFLAEEWGRSPAPASPLFGALDTNHDGLITREECRQAPELRVLCATADRNSDGAVDAAEFAALQRRAQSAPRIEPYILPASPDGHTKAI